MCFAPTKNILEESHCSPISRYYFTQKTLNIHPCCRQEYTFERHSLPLRNKDLQGLKHVLLAKGQNKLMILSDRRASREYSKGINLTKITSNSLVFDKLQIIRLYTSPSLSFTNFQNILNKTFLINNFAKQPAFLDKYVNVHYHNDVEFHIKFFTCYSCLDSHK